MVVGEEARVGGWEVYREVRCPKIAADGCRNSLFAVEDQLTEDVVLLSKTGFMSA
jgi:hypothetical protein